MVSNGLPITSLLDIGANISANTVLPVVDLPANTSNKANLALISDYILNSNLDANLGNLGVSGNITLTNNTILEDSVAPAAFKITTDTNVGVIINSGNTQAWAFDVFGNLTFPDSSVQNTAWIGTVVAANVIGLGNISSANFDGNSSNVLLGDGTFTALPSISGNIANTNLDGNAANVLYGNGIFASIQGDGGNLSNIVGANVTGEVGYAAVANSVDVANVVGIGNIATVNLDGNASNVLLGDGTFSSVPGLGNIASINIDGNASNVLLGNGVFSSVQGDGGNLSNITGGNVSGEVAYAATANSVAGANVSGEVGYAAVANSVAASNVSGLGNIATLNTDGNASNVLLGNGVFSSVPGIGNIASLNTDGNSSNVLYGNGVFAAAPSGGGASISNGTSNVNIDTSGGNVTTSVAGNANVLVVTGTGANITGTLNSTGNLVAANANLGNLVTANFFQGDGGLLTNITVAGGTAIVNGNSNVTVAANGNVTVGVAGNANVMTVDGANVTLGANGYVKLVCSPVIDDPIAIGGRYTGSGTIASEVSIGNASNTTAGAFYTSLGTSTGFYTQETDGAGNVFFSSLDTDTLSMVSNLGIGGNNIQLKNSPYPKFTLNANTCNFDIDTLFASKSSSIVYMQDNNTFAYLSMGPYTLYMDDGTANTGMYFDVTAGLSVAMYDVDGNTVYDITGSNSNLAGTFTANTVKSNVAFQMPLYASDAARDAAIPVPAQGMMVFNQTGNVFQGYTGTVWANLN